MGPVSSSTSGLLSYAHGSCASACARQWPNRCSSPDRARRRQSRRTLPPARSYPSCAPRSQASSAPCTWTHPAPPNPPAACDPPSCRRGLPARRHAPGAPPARAAACASGYASALPSRIRDPTPLHPRLRRRSGGSCYACALSWLEKPSSAESGGLQRSRGRTPLSPPLLGPAPARSARAPGSMRQTRLHPHPRRRRPRYRCWATSAEAHLKLQVEAFLPVRVGIAVGIVERLSSLRMTCADPGERLASEPAAGSSGGCVASSIDVMVDAWAVCRLGRCARADHVRRCDRLRALAGRSAGAASPAGADAGRGKSTLAVSAAAPPPSSCAAGSVAGSSVLGDCSVKPPSPAGLTERLAAGQAPPATHAQLRGRAARRSQSWAPPGQLLALRGEGRQAPAAANPRLDQLMLLLLRQALCMWSAMCRVNSFCVICGRSYHGWQRI